MSNDRFWHKADISRLSYNVRFWGCGQGRAIGRQIAEPSLGRRAGFSGHACMALVQPSARIVRIHPSDIGLAENYRS